jgi:histidyl-tRNA synthetase
MIAQLSNEYEANELFAAGLREISEIDSLLSTLGFDESRMVFDPSLVRGMAYYTGPIFEVQSLLSFTDAKGNTRSVGSICGGGRYDGLVKRLLGVEVPATGASIGVDRLAELLTLSNTAQTEYKGPVIVTVFDNSLMPEYQKIAQELRAANIPVQVFYGVQKNLKKQLAYADSIQSPVAILLGSDELAAGVVTVRNLTLGAQMSGDIQNKEEWKAKAQQQVSREALVAKVKEILKL